MTRDRGSALIIVLLSMTVVASVGAALALTTTAEMMIAGDFARMHEARYAAEGALEKALVDIAAIGDWNLLAGGFVTSAFTDGSPFGARTIPGGGRIDLAGVVNVANCGKAAACSTSELAANANGQRPWAANNPIWHLFAYGPFAAMLPDGLGLPYYVVVFVGDDPAETDGVPSIDGAVPCEPAQRPPACNPGSGAIAVRAEAFGPAGAHQVVEAVVARPSALGKPVRTRAQWTRDVR